MRKILTAAALLASAATFAQNINPTVEVTNTYQGNPSEMHKPQLGMTIPDSLLRFDMDFGYEVFEKPYQGAYNFKPYMLNMKPDKDVFRGNSLYLRAGAGYSLHPQLDFVYSPLQDGPFQMSVYATHRSYFGKYNTIGAILEDDHYKLEKVAGKSYKGHDALTTFGFDGRYNWDNSILSFGVGYYGLMTQDTLLTRSYNAADFNLRFRSNRNDERYFYYDAMLKGRFGADNLDYSGRANKMSYGYLVEPSIYYTGGKGNLNESVFSLNAEVGPVLSYYQRVLVGLEAETASYGGDFLAGNAGRIAVVPKYQIESGEWRFSFGAKVEKLLTGSESDSTSAFMPLFSKGGTKVYPDIHFSVAPLGNMLLYASLTGGAWMNTYSSIMASNHHFNPSYAKFVPLLDNSIEKMKFKAGVKGSLWSKLSYDLSAGGSKVENGLVDAPVWLTVLPMGIYYQDYSLMFADLLLGYNAGGFDIDAAMRYRRMTFDEDVSGLKLPTWSATVRAIYNFNPRVYAGFLADMATSRDGEWGLGIPTGLTIGPVAASTLYCRIPGYFDLGLLAGYQFNRKLSLWLESGNLLCETIQRNPFYSEKDLWVTAGITLNL